MLRNYLIIGLRNMAKSPMQSLIKIFGLAVGVTGCLVVILAARYELSFDRFQPDRDRIYRIYCSFSGVWSGENRGVPLALPAKVNDTFTGLESTTFFQTYSARVTVIDSLGNKNRLDRQNSMILAAPDYFEVFNFYTWIAGSPDALKDPFTVALTESKAIKYFGTVNPDRVIGKPLTYADSLDVTVVGLVKDVKENTDFDFTDFISFATIQSSWLKKNYNDFTDWGSVTSSSQFFVKRSAATPLTQLEAQMPLLVKAKEDAEKDPDKDSKTAFLLQPLSSMHFNTRLAIFDSSRSVVSLTTLKTLGIIAVLLLIIAAVNFINLETAQAIRRAREVGLRKVMGGTRAALILHFMGESFLVTGCAVILSVPLTYFTFLFFSEFLPAGLLFSWTDPFLWGLIGLTLVVVATLSGLYPALVISSYQPAQVLKNQLLYGRRSRSAIVRKGLTVFQFTFSQALIVATVIVNLQIGYLLSSELGFAWDAILIVNTPWWQKPAKVEVLRNELAKIADIKAITRFDRAPASSGWSSTTIKYKTDKEEVAFTSHIKSGDTSYLSVFKIPLLHGRNVQPREDVAEFLVNESFCKKMGLDPAAAVGQTVKRGDKDYTIVGVIRDFHFQSLHHAIEPMYFRYESDASGLALQVATVNGRMLNMDGVLEKVNAALAKVYPDDKVEPHFFDDTIRQFYESEQRVAKLTDTATGLAVFVSCLGLLGLASFTASQRTKEIGIRKVHGATVNHIVMLLSKEFLLLVALAFLAAVPLAWYAADRWLQDFAYRVDIPVWVFALAGILSLIVAFLTVAFQSIKAAVTDPVDSLRYE